jgi:hypothetical protein
MSRIVIIILIYHHHELIEDLMSYKLNSPTCKWAIVMYLNIVAVYMHKINIVSLRFMTVIMQVMVAIMKNICKLSFLNVTYSFGNQTVNNLLFYCVV